MAKKKITIQPKVKKVKAPSVSQEAKMVQMAKDLTGLVYHPGWMVLKEINENNIEFLDEQIIRKTDPEGKPINEVDCDRLRDKRNYLEELMETPMKFIAKMKQDGQIPESFDPYFKSVGEIKEVATNTEH